MDAGFIMLGKIGRRIFWVTLVAYFLLPMVAMARFAFQSVPTFLLTWDNALTGWGLDSIKRAFTDEGMIKSLILSLELTVFTIALTFVVLIPLATFIEIKAPRLKPVMAAATLIPWLVPPVALVVGVAATFRQTSPGFLSSPFSLVPFYTLWMLPFTYRAVEGQLRLIGIRNLYEAAQSVGCTGLHFFLKVVVPNLKTALFVSTGLIVASVLGEYTFASLLLKQTQPVYLLAFQTEDTKAGFAVALILMLATAVLLGVAVSRLRKRGINFSATGI